MKKQTLSEEFRRMQKLAGIITEGEFYDRDSTHRDTYGDTYGDFDDERNYDEEEEEYGEAEIVGKRLIDDRGDEYSNYIVFNTKEELEKEMEDPTYGEKAGYYNLPDGRVAVAFPHRSSRGEDFGGM